MKVLFLEYPPCSTCQKAKKWLDSHNVSYESRHIKEKNPTAGIKTVASEKRSSAEKIL